MLCFINKIKTTGILNLKLCNIHVLMCSVETFLQFIHGPFPQQCLFRRVFMGQILSDTARRVEAHSW